MLRRKHRPLTLAIASSSLLLLCAGLYVAAAQVQKKAAKEEPAGGLQVTTKLSDTVSLSTPKGGKVLLHVELKQWYLTNVRESATIPVEAFTIFHVVAGDVVVRIGDKAEELRHTGDYWTAEKGSRAVVSLSPPQESATLETLAANSGH
jgi:hypothetical protein